MTLYRGGKSLRRKTENQCSLIVKGPPSIYFCLRIIHWDTFFFQLIIVCSANTVLGTAVSDVFRQRSMWHDSHLLHPTIGRAEVLSNFTHRVASSRESSRWCVSLRVHRKSSNFHLGQSRWRWRRWNPGEQLRELIGFESKKREIGPGTRQKELTQHIWWMLRKPGFV